MSREAKAETASREHFDVILPAGGRIPNDFAQIAGTDVKALIALNGQTILRRTILALQATKRVGRLVVIGPPEALTEAKNAGVAGRLAEGASGPDNILSGLKWLQAAQQVAEPPTMQEAFDSKTAGQNAIRQEAFDSKAFGQQAIESKSGGREGGRVLIVATDLPFLTGRALNSFLDACPADADIAVPILTQQEYEARFPGTINEFVRLKDGSFTVGGVFVLNRATLLHIESHLRALFAARKNQWQMARLVGFGTILKFVTRQLTVTQLVARASTIAQCRGVALLHMPPELAYDIDLPADFRYAQENLATADPGTSLPI